MKLVSSFSILELIYCILLPLMEILSMSAVADPEISKPERGGVEFSVSGDYFDSNSHIPMSL